MGEPADWLPILASLSLLGLVIAGTALKKPLFKKPVVEAAVKRKAIQEMPGAKKGLCYLVTFEVNGAEVPVEVPHAVYLDCDCGDAGLLQIGRFGFVSFDKY